MVLWTKGQILIFASVQKRAFVLELSINKEFQIVYPVSSGVRRA